MTDRPGVYFLEGYRSELIKIGYGSNVGARVSAVRCHSPEPLVLLGVLWCDEPKARETEIHAQFAHLRQHGEWFKVGMELLEFIADNTEFIYDDHWEITRAGNAIQYGRGWNDGRRQAPSSPPAVLG